MTLDLGGLADWHPVLVVRRPPKARIWSQDAVAALVDEELRQREVPLVVRLACESAIVLFQINDSLKEIRNEKGLSLADLTEATGIDRASISKLESGQRANPTLATVSKYAAALGKKVVVSVVDA